jgi:hypothetical protein
MSARRHRRIPARFRLVFVAALALVLLIGVGLKRVPSGSEAVRIGRGGDVSVLSSGWHLVAPGTALVFYPTGAHSLRVPQSGTTPVIFMDGDSLSLAFRFDVTIPNGVSSVLYQRLSRDFDAAFARMVVAAAELEAAGMSDPAPGVFEASVIARVKGELAPLGINEVDGTLVRWGDLSFEAAEGESDRAKIPAPRRLVIVGVDGGDWLNLRPLIDAGKLPNFARLVRDGATGPLRSEEPMLSPLLWTTMATGRYPEDHGVLDFTVVDPVSGAERRRNRLAGNRPGGASDRRGDFGSFRLPGVCAARLRTRGSDQRLSQGAPRRIFGECGLRRRRPRRRSRALRARPAG